VQAILQSSPFAAAGYTIELNSYCLLTSLSLSAAIILHALYHTGF